MTRVLILGGNGMLGHKLVQQLSRDLEVFSTVRPAFVEVARFGIFTPEKTIDNVDVTDFYNLSIIIEQLRPDVVINAVGVIKQAAAAADTDNMLLINSTLPQRLKQFSAEFGFRLICISTDCVFSGRKGNYSESDVPDAVDDYGRSKLLGEVDGHNCLTLRTSIIGRELDTTHSLIEWFLSRSNRRVGGYVNAVYTGLPTIVFAELLRRLINDHRDLSGIYHVSSEPISKFDLLGIVNDIYRANIDLVPDTSYVIDRSLDSSSFRAATGFVPEPWKAMIEQMAADPTPYKEFRSR